jgi:DNA-binding CsgD family transcriptional regulator
MERLRSRDLRALLESLRDLYALRSFETFTAHVGPALRRVIPSEGSSYSDFDLRRRVLREVGDPPLPEAALRAFARHVDEHPLVDHYRRTRDPEARKVSDFVGRRQLHRLALYREYVRPFFGAVDHQLACTFVAFPARVIGVALSRGVTDFTERERLLLNLLRPHLVQASENARAVDRMTTDLRRFRDGLESLDRGLVFVSPDGRVRLATGRARDWLARYFGTRAGTASHLPETLRRWAVAQVAALTPGGDPAAVRLPLVVSQDDRRLVARLVTGAGESVVLLEEQRAPQPTDLAPLGLSRREAEVLTWVSYGKTNAEIAILLGVRTRTVEKHLERVYQKLGVETRTAAAALLHTAR